MDSLGARLRPINRSHQPFQFGPVDQGLGSIQAVQNPMIQIGRGYENRRLRREFLLHHRFSKICQKWRIMQGSLLERTIYQSGRCQL